MGNNNGMIKGMLIALLVIYVISPLDIAPGPIDDVLLILMGIAGNKRVNNGGQNPPDDMIEGSWQQK